MGRAMWLPLLLFSSLLWVVAAQATDPRLSLDESVDQGHRWNRFVHALHKLHGHLVSQHHTRTEQRVGGYGGYSGGPEFFREVKTYDATSGRLLSMIRWERTEPERIHTIEVFVYDEDGRLARDYVAAYLPVFRNAPFQTLINLHHYKDDLHAFRQFDASGTRIYEQCKGRLLNEKIEISLEEDRIPNRTALIPDVTLRAAYKACFDGVPARAGPYLDPLVEIGGGPERVSDAIRTPVPTGAAAQRIERYTRAIAANPRDAGLYVERGQAYLDAQQFDRAIEDFSIAITLNDDLDQAYFGRGMAYGRARMLEEGISDLTIFIGRNPNSSLAHTKRGVRYIWKGDLERAHQDLSRALVLDETNAEAQDDLGVVYARRGQYAEAIQHLRAAIRHDPSYQKAYHNLAIVYYLTDRSENALAAVNKALALEPQGRNSLLLKSAILRALGGYQEARVLEERAKSLPEADWSERFSIQ